MPYELRKTGPKSKPWCVFNKTTGAKKGCSKTESMAKKFMAKLYVEEGKKEMGDKITHLIIEDIEGVRYKASYSITEDDEFSIAEKEEWLELKDVSLTDQSRQARKAFYNTFGNAGYYNEPYWVNRVFKEYLIVEDSTDYELYKVTYTESDDGYEFAEKDAWKKVEVEYIEKEAPPVEKEEETQGLVDKVKQLWENVFPPESAPLFITKQQEDGRFRWVMISSTAFLDGEEEIVSTKALADNQPLAEKDYGELRFWHVPPIKLGNCDFQMPEGVCLVESGLWDDNEIATPIRKAINEKPKDWKVSIGFVPLQDPSENVLVKSTVVKKVWDAIQIKERSVLPKKYAANKFACIVTEGGITVDEKKEEVLRELLGDDLATQVISNVDGLNKKALEDDAVVKGQEIPEPTPAPTPKEETVITKEALVEVLKELKSLPDRFKKLEEDMQKLKDDVAPRGAVSRASEDTDTTVSKKKAEELVGPTELKAIEEIVDTMLGNI